MDADVGFREHRDAGDAAVLGELVERGWAAGTQFSHAFLLAGSLSTLSLILCFSVSFRSDRVVPAA